MNGDERKMLDLLVEMNEQTAGILQGIGGQISSLQKSIESQSKSLSAAIANGSISLLLISELIAEIADGNREKLDQILARSVTVAESYCDSSDTQGGAIILAVLDDVIESSEAAFSRRTYINDR